MHKHNFIILILKIPLCIRLMRWSNSQQKRIMCSFKFAYSMDHSRLVISIWYIRFVGVDLHGVIWLDFVVLLFIDLFELIL